MSSPLKLRSVILRSARLLSDVYNEVLSQHQLNYSLWQVMYLVQEQPDITSIDLAKFLNVSKPSIAKRVQVLMQLDIIKQVATADKRQKGLQLSQHGQLLFQLCSDKIDHCELQLLSQFNHLSLEQTYDTLSSLIDVLQKQKNGELS